MGHIDLERAALTLRTNLHVPLLDDPPLGHLQALVLDKLECLGSEAYGLAVLESLSLQTGVWIDHSQIYGSIRKLVNKEFVRQTESRSQKNGPPLKIYELTAAGRAALAATIAHHKALVSHFVHKRKATRK